MIEVGTVNVVCPYRCGENLAIPVEIISDVLTDGSVGATLSIPDAAIVEACQRHVSATLHEEQ